MADTQGKRGLLDFLNSQELQDSVYLYLPEQNRIGTFTVSREEHRLRVWVAPEFSGLDRHIVGVGRVLGYLQPPARWHHLTFVRGDEQASMYRAYERLLEQNHIPVVKLDDLAGVSREEPSVPVRELLLREDTPDYDGYRLKEIIARRVPIDFSLREHLRGLSIEPID